MKLNKSILILLALFSSHAHSQTSSTCAYNPSNIYDKINFKPENLNDIEAAFLIKNLRIRAKTKTVKARWQR